MNSNEEANKKNYWLVYTIVFVFYAIMIVIYGVVCHLATEDGAVSDWTVDDSTNEQNGSAIFDMVNKLMAAFQEGIKTNGLEGMQTLEVQMQ